MKVVITVQPGAGLDEVVSQIEALGGSVQQRLHALNLLMAEVPEPDIHRVNEIAGIRAVEPDRGEFRTDG